MTAILGEKPDWWDEIEPLIHQAARAIHREYKALDYSDLVSTAWMWCVKHPTARTRYLEDEDRRQGTKMILGALRNAVKDFARKEKAELLGYEVSDEAWYGIELIKDLLEYIYDDEAWLDPPQPKCKCKTARCHCDHQPRRGGDPAEGNTWLATLADVSRAVDRLSDYNRWLIEAHYRDSWTYVRIGDELDPPKSATTVGRHMDRAVRAVQANLGGFRPHHDPSEEEWEEALTENERKALQRLRGGPGARRAISNANARGVTDGQ